MLVQRGLARIERHDTKNNCLACVLSLPERTVPAFPSDRERSCIYCYLLLSIAIYCYLLRREGGATCPACSPR